MSDSKNRKLYVEMTDAEYDEYRKFKNGKYVPSDEIVEKISVHDFLVMAGYKCIKSGIHYSEMACCDIATEEYVKEKTTIWIEVLSR